MLSPQSVAAPSGERERRLKVLYLQVKLCDPCLSALRTRYLSSKALYKSTYLYLLPSEGENCVISLLYSSVSRTDTRPLVQKRKTDWLATHGNIQICFDWLNKKQEVKVVSQKAPHGGPIPRLGVTPGGRKLYHWIPGVGFPISVPQ